MKNKVSFVPVHSVIYLIVFSFLLGASFSLLVLRVCLKWYTIDPFYLICGILTSVAMITMVISSLIEWNKMFIDKQ